MSRFARFMATVFAQRESKYYTEGAENVAWVEGYSTGPGSVAKNADHLYMYAENASGAAVRTYVTDSAVDLTNIKTLFIEWENVGALAGASSYLVASTSKTGNHATSDASLMRSGVFSKDVDELDVTALTGSYYLRIHAREGAANVISTVKAYRVWGE